VEIDGMPNEETGRCCDEKTAGCEPLTSEAIFYRRSQELLADMKDRARVANCREFQSAVTSMEVSVMWQRHAMEMTKANKETKT
jgi:hypothetical protein